MFTVEIKINSALVAHIYGVNEADGAEGSQYRYDLYNVADRTVKAGMVSHDPEDGVLALVKKILDKEV